jgi:hypothetical protein
VVVVSGNVIKKLWVKLRVPRCRGHIGISLLNFEQFWSYDSRALVNR